MVQLVGPKSVFDFSFEERNRRYDEEMHGPGSLSYRRHLLAAALLTDRSIAAGWRRRRVLEKTLCRRWYSWPHRLVEWWVQDCREAERLAAFFLFHGSGAERWRERRRWGAEEAATGEGGRVRLISAWSGCGKEAARKAEKIAWRVGGKRDL
ncbi:Os06g0619900 [Oryza sativa Japonica Group]|uniref:Uncharacterized protein n=2 Tax=Oryza sativa subsp. japonica TaxID=39947 RepID=Q69XX6_ORYSJ|nr:hypothetical protein [Oryza sativa Japonica Group]BAD35439.1 hypothetical protein [Oryza sativa Japonica Group]BAS98651.1 Os06g0619900 [Oryza sativa Japonica Group]